MYNQIQEDISEFIKISHFSIDYRLWKIKKMFFGLRIMARIEILLIHTDHDTWVLRVSYESGGN